ncbi:hypothetical protein DTO021D3_5190 [Paecilomyces variotii]|nr:hypothetical protein DTO032I3_6231 [Paecilomyces variotii]KAJ9277866.1 hypothetical protein DTO021D3_5190 [Paecilomyces variotii]KAJ9341529.1 hypothetical protein DTO027B6_5893 [Paecilomyces variotii]KAJ9379127.1 hypothetical protein DTO032I4_7384 [Paecilomyces variotii]
MGSAACDGEPSVLAWTNKAVNLVNLGLPLAGPVPSQNLPARCSQAFRLAAGWLSCPERTGPLSRSLRSGFPKGPRRLPRQEGKWFSLCWSCPLSSWHTPKFPNELYAGGEMYLVRVVRHTARPTVAGKQQRS